MAEAAAVAGADGASGGAALQGDPADSMERILMIAERCLDEDVASFRDSIQAIVDQVEELRRGVAAREVRSWATRLLFILTRCSRLVATEESSPFGGHALGGGGGGGGHLTAQPRSKGPCRLRRFSGFPMLRGQLSLDPHAPRNHHLSGLLAGGGVPAAAVSPRGGASPLLRSATAPSRSIKDLMVGMHHLRVAAVGEGAGAGTHRQQLSPMPESPATLRSPGAASAASDGLSTPSHPVRQVGLSPLGRSVVTALEAELEQAAAAAAQQHRDPSAPGEQQTQAGPGATPAHGPASSGTDSPMASDSPSKRQGLFKLLKMRFHSLRSASKEPRPAASVAAELADGEGSTHSSSSTHGDGDAQGLSTPRVRAGLQAVALVVARELLLLHRRPAGTHFLVGNFRSLLLPCRRRRLRPPLPRTPRRQRSTSSRSRCSMRSKQQHSRCSSKCGRHRCCRCCCRRATAVGGPCLQTWRRWGPQRAHGSCSACTQG